MNRPKRGITRTGSQIGTFSVKRKAGSEGEREKGEERAPSKKPKSKLRREICGYVLNDGSVCDEMVQTGYNKKRHIREQHEGFVLKCQSEICGYMTTSSARLCDHRRTAHVKRAGEISEEDKLTVVSCGVCDSSFYDNNYLQKHTSQVHSMAGEAEEEIVERGVEKTVEKAVE